MSKLLHPIISQKSTIINYAKMFTNKCVIIYTRFLIY